MIRNWNFLSPLLRCILFCSELCPAVCVCVRIAAFSHLIEKGYEFNLLYFFPFIFVCVSLSHWCECDALFSLVELCQHQQLNSQQTDPYYTHYYRAVVLLYRLRLYICVRQPHSQQFVRIRERENRVNGWEQRLRPYARGIRNSNTFFASPAQSVHWSKFPQRSLLVLLSFFLCSFLSVGVCRSFGYISFASFSL